MNYEATNIPKTSITDFLFSLWPIFVLILVIVIILVIYHKTVGYYIDYGFKRIWSLISKEEAVEVKIGNEEQPIINAVIEKDKSESPENEMKKELQMLQALQLDRDRKAQESMAAAASASSASANESDDEYESNPFSSESVSSVYNISQNIYTYYDAPAVCKAFNGELATYEQVKEAYKQGADWCNYGWVKGQQAVYPTQKATYAKLQKGPEKMANSCGKPGVNGGYFDNPELRFGVNCYGIRPPKTALDENVENQAALPPSTEELEFDKKVQKYRENINFIAISPFSHGR